MHTISEGVNGMVSLERAPMRRQAGLISGRHNDGRLLMTELEILIPYDVRRT